VRKPEPLFLVIIGAVTALFLPFALAFPRTLLEKLGAVVALVLVAAGISALVMALKKRQRNQ
jgi:predicted benzoate:H+ symporter BenE